MSAASVPAPKQGPTTSRSGQKKILTLELTPKASAPAPPTTAKKRNHSNGVRSDPMRIPTASLLASMNSATATTTQSGTGPMPNCSIPDDTSISSGSDQSDGPDESESSSMSADIASGSDGDLDDPSLGDSDSDDDWDNKVEWDEAKLLKANAKKYWNH